jgi:hypothetical protein
MEALTPREIQTRIRSGEALDDVVKIAGMSADRVETFAAPVLAERDHIAALALASPVRRAGEPGSGRGLRQVVAERLLSRGLDIDLVDWDAWRRSDGRWIAEGRYQSGGAKHVARFIFDAQGKFSVAENDEARWLIGDPSPNHGPERRRRADGDDSEPTVDLYDDEEGDGDAEALAEDEAAGDLGWDMPDFVTPRVTPSWMDVPVPDADDLEPGHRSALDSLYEMISVIEEDSVKIYRGLREPLPGLDESLQEDTRPALSVPLPPDSESDLSVPVPHFPDLVEHAPLAPLGLFADEESVPVPDAPAAPEAKAEDSDKVVPMTQPRRRSTRRSRASVPSWDEIMFGGPPSSA